MAQPQEPNPSTVPEKLQTEVAAQSVKIFKASEVPEFTDLSRYWDWRCIFVRFALSNPIESTDIPTALNRIASDFQEPPKNLHAEELGFHLRSLFRSPWMRNPAKTDENILSIRALVAEGILTLASGKILR
ncbi:hypothetical protein SI65_08301 [Aspergillus cristatus]|uniref:Uncharacterized protein n=1 Tax=Aspergillus cristatus TaxID=573508 RepID=A0A1E3B5S2_ASPCR|nr:hypothetical protein SI65_08301 [Aspergillus cristatus]